KFFKKALCNLKCTAKNADVLAKYEDIRVATHFGAECVTYSLKVSSLRHLSKVTTARRSVLCSRKRWDRRGFNRLHSSISIIVSWIVRRRCKQSFNNRFRFWERHRFRVFNRCIGPALTICFYFCKVPFLDTRALDKPSSIHRNRIALLPKAP